MVNQLETTEFFIEVHDTTPIYLCKKDTALPTTLEKNYTYWALSAAPYGPYPPVLIHIYCKGDEMPDDSRRDQLNAAIQDYVGQLLDEARGEGEEGDEQPAKKILMSSNEKGIFRFEVVDQVPEGAEEDNYVQTNLETFHVYVMPGTAVLGRTFALQMWAEQYFGSDEDEQESDGPDGGEFDEGED